LRQPSADRGTVRPTVAELMTEARATTSTGVSVQPHPW
jgi:hypothetical protein